MSSTVTRRILDTRLPAACLGCSLITHPGLRTGRWSGWHRFTPLAAGLFFVVVVMPSFALPGRDFEYAIAVWGVCFLLLGMAMRAEAAHLEPA